MRGPRFSTHERTPDIEDYAPRSVMRAYLIAIGITILLGLITGSIWIGWNLIRLHVLG
jgi:hypothetical protein